MQGHELESLIKRVLAESEHPRISEVNTLDERFNTGNLGVHVVDSGDGSEGYCKFVQVTNSAGRVQGGQWNIPKEMR